MFCCWFIESPHAFQTLHSESPHRAANESLNLFQDELSDFTGSKSATPMSTTASDMEREDGNSKSTEVQAAPGTRSISVGRVRRL